MKVSEALDAAVNALREDSSEIPGLYERRVFGDSKCSMYVAISRPSDLNHLLVVFKRASIRARCELDTKGFRVRVEPFDDHGHVRVRLEESQRGFDDLFRQLRNDIVSAILSSASEEQAFDAMRTRLAHWQRFMERAGDGMTPAQQLGLYGELYFLRHLVVSGCSQSKALDGWKGPLAANHDFMFGSTALEVKATASNSGTKVRIANERQLDDTGVERLFLCHLSFDRRENAGQKLPALVEEIRTFLDSPNQIAFADRLLAAGYHSSQAELYNEVGYTERGTAFYRVSGLFPRVIPADLKPGVQEVSYMVELVGATPYLVPAVEVVASIM